MTKPIDVAGRLVVLHGDEMAQVAFERILERFVREPLNVNLVELDLSAEHRLTTNGAVIIDAINALKEHGVGIKNAGMTVNRAQLDALLEAHPDIDRETLLPLATKSPNGTIRKGIGGNIIREDIPFRNLRIRKPDWIGREIDVDTMDNGGIDHSYSELAPHTGMLKLMFVGASGDPIELHRRRINRGDPWLVTSNAIDEVRDWARRFFQRAVDERRDAYVGLKDTVIAGYDGVMRAEIEAIFEAEYRDAFKANGISYVYGLIDAQAAYIVANPPERALWGVPDNTTGMKLVKLVEELKAYGLHDRQCHVSISRMSAGGGDQYGSYNAPAPEDGILKAVLDGVEKHARDIRAGDPILLMSNDRAAIKDWVRQVFRDASVNNKEVYFGLKQEYLPYDGVFSQVISEARRELAEVDTKPPSYMVMRPSYQLKKLICDPPRNALYPSQNLDGDIFSDIAAALGGSLATASSVIESTDGTMLFEAPHGTAHDLYERYLASDGEEAIFNPSALLYALANALATMARREDNAELAAYAADLKSALIQTVADGVITGDIRGKTAAPERERLVDLWDFLAAVQERMQAAA
ncbi:MAG: isocitrate/isopropylmalate family dehydrogenase [Pseudomonadota bacterium]